MQEKVMRGLVKEKGERGAVLKNVPIPQVGPNEILVKIHYAAICGTDQHIYQWNSWAQERVPLPMVFGHEFSGEIVEVGDNVTAYK